MSTLINEVDARTQSAGANQMELLLFHVGTPELFGINVFKVREVMKLPSLTRVPDADPRIKGVANIRGVTIPIIDLRAILGLGAEISGAEGEPANRKGSLIVTEYNSSLQGFMVSGVHRIVRMSWAQIKTPPRLVRENNTGMVTAVTMLEDGRMVLILDVEKILCEIVRHGDDDVYAGVESQSTLQAKCVLFADDSSVARTQIKKALERLGISFIQATTGKEAWEKLIELADRAAAEQQTIFSKIQLVISDIEMPDMDGFTLTKHIRSDPRTAQLPVLLHSSLTGMCNMEKGKGVGATDYIAKFDPKVLGEKILLHCK